MSLKRREGIWLSETPMLGDPWISVSHDGLDKAMKQPDKSATGKISISEDVIRQLIAEMTAGPVTEFTNAVIALENRVSELEARVAELESMTLWSYLKKAVLKIFGR